jgi:hypothetical protein
MLSWPTDRTSAPAPASPRRPGPDGHPGRLHHQLLAGAPPSPTGQGVYGSAFPSSVSPARYTAAHATLNRIDLVYLRSGTTRSTRPACQGRRRLPGGHPSATPVAPTPAGTQIYMPLATITVLSVANGGTASVSTAVRPSTVAPGGILPRRPPLQPVHRAGLPQRHRPAAAGTASAWDTYVKVPGAWTSYTPTWTGRRHQPDPRQRVLIGRYSKIGRQATGPHQPHPRLDHDLRLRQLQLGFSCRSPRPTTALLHRWPPSRLGTDRWHGADRHLPGATTFSAASSTCRDEHRHRLHDPTRPETSHNGDQLRITLVYESAT